MRIIDLVLLIPLIFGAYKGYQKGLIMELIQLVAFVLAIVLGLKLIHVGVFYLEPYVGDVNGFLPILSFFLIFIATIYLMQFVGKLAKGFAKVILLGWLDNFAGGVVSLLKWAFALSLLIWVAHSVDIAPKPEVIKTTVIYSKLLEIAPSIIDTMGMALPFVKDIFEYIKAL